MAGSPRAFGGLVALAGITGAAAMAYGLWDPGSMLGLAAPAAPAMGASAATDPAPGSGAGATVSEIAASAEGRELYLSSCATCHGPDGRGTTRGPSLEAAGAAAWDFYLRSGRMPLKDPDQPFLPGPPAYDDEEIAALVAYGRELGSGPDRPDIVADAEVDAGRRLYVNTCAACHGVAASGAAIGPDAFAPSLRGVDPQLIAEAPLVGPGPMPRFELDDAQLSNIAAYLEQLSDTPPPGGFELRGFGPVAEGLVALLIGLPMILLAVRWIGASDAGRPSPEVAAGEGGPSAPDEGPDDATVGKVDHDDGSSHPEPERRPTDAAGAGDPTDASGAGDPTRDDPTRGDPTRGDPTDSDPTGGDVFRSTPADGAPGRGAIRRIAEGGLALLAGSAVMVLLDRLVGPWVRPGRTDRSAPSPDGNDDEP